MANIPIYRTDDGENFIVIVKFDYLKKTYFGILNVLDEYLCNNDLIRFPIIDAREANRC